MSELKQAMYDAKQYKKDVETAPYAYRRAFPKDKQWQEYTNKVIKQQQKQQKGVY